jgi:hypothetical protein
MDYAVLGIAPTSRDGCGAQFYTMDSASLGLATFDCSMCAVLIFSGQFPLEDVAESHALVVRGVPHYCCGLSPN